jgi:hypothetical protein
MKTQFTILGLALVASGARGWEPPVATAPPAGVAFPLDLAVIDPDAKDDLPPYIVMFEEGRDSRGKDVRRPLARLESFRGESKMFPESNRDDGLPVVLRGLRLHSRLNSEGGVLGYDIELQGEYNMIKVPAAKEEVEKFLAGQPATFTLRGEKNYGLYSYVSTMKMEIQLTEGELAIRNLEGNFTFREGFRTYTSHTKKLSPPTGRSYLYRGQRGELPKLPSI